MLLCSKENTVEVERIVHFLHSEELVFWLVDECAK